MEPMAHLKKYISCNICVHVSIYCILKSSFVQSMKATKSRGNDVMELLCTKQGGDCEVWLPKLGNESICICKGVIVWGGVHITLE